MLVTLQEGGGEEEREGKVEGEEDTGEEWVSLQEVGHTAVPQVHRRDREWLSFSTHALPRSLRVTRPQGHLKVLLLPTKLFTVKHRLHILVEKASEE
jgi:hypothetical protein